jgi:predicted histone-like DNA-binding protein
MSQKIQVYKNTTSGSTTFGKYYVRPVYDNSYITTDELADFIQVQATVKRSDCKAVLDELGSAFKHFFEMGQKIKLDNIGIFKIGVKSSPSDTFQGCGAANVKSCHVIFIPETESVSSGETAEAHRAIIVDGTPTAVTYRTKVYNHPAVMLKDVRFEMTKDPKGSGISE